MARALYIGCILGCILGPQSQDALRVATHAWRLRRSACHRTQALGLLFDGDVLAPDTGTCSPRGRHTHRHTDTEAGGSLSAHAANAASGLAHARQVRTRLSAWLMCHVPLLCRVAGLLLLNELGIDWPGRFQLSHPVRCAHTPL